MQEYRETSAGWRGESILLFKFKKLAMETNEIYINPSWLKTLQFENLTFSSAFDYHLTNRDLDKAYRELNEPEKTKKQCIHMLRERLERDKENVYRTDESYLLRYLRFSKFNCDKAYKALRKLHSLRIKYPENFELLPNLEILLNSNFFTCLPYKDEEGRLLIWLDFRKWNTDEMPFSQVLCMITAFLDVVFASPHIHINGVVGIWDFQGFSMRHVSQLLRPSSQWFMANILQDCSTYRLKHCFAINCNALMKTGYAAIRYLMKNKMINRIKILGSDLTELHQHVNSAILPKEYGGTLEESECGITDFIMSNLDYLKYERSFRTKAASKLR